MRMKRFYFFFHWTQTMLINVAASYRNAISIGELTSVYHIFIMNSPGVGRTYHFVRIVIIWAGADNIQYVEIV